MTWKRLAVCVSLLASAIVALPSGSATAGSALSGASAAEAEGDGKAPADPMAVVAAMQPGWNVGNTLDAIPDETSWGNPRITRELLRHIRSQGFKSIRIPITWTDHQGGAPDHAIDPAFLARVKEVVDWALAADLYVLINMHHDSWQWVLNMPGDRTNVLNRYNSTWTQIAGTFRNTSRRLLFESINEPQFTGSSGQAQEFELLNELNTSFHRIVRSSGGINRIRLLVLPTLHTSDEQAPLDSLSSTMAALNDRNLVATFHFYSFWPFSVNVAGFTTYNADVQNDLVTRFDRVYHTFVSRGIPVILGEYGLLGFDRHTGTVEQGEKLKFFEHFGYYARAKRITTMWWDNGQHLDRTTFQWRDPELVAQIRSSWITRSGTASADFVYNARSSAISAKTITLNLNGTSLVAVRQGNAYLVPGRDYTVAGDQLTFTEAALTRLSSDRAYGVNAQVHLVFSRGVPWRVDIRTFDIPLLGDATGLTDSFAIPVQFRGDQVATMEAKYDDGSNAGPHNWTSFKEFDVTFAPDYGAGTIALKQAFFNEVNDGRRVTLTFHFWSGNRVTYHVTKNGTAVTGSTS